MLPYMLVKICSPDCISKFSLNSLLIISPEELWQWPVERYCAVACFVLNLRCSDILQRSSELPTATICALLATAFLWE